MKVMLDLKKIVVVIKNRITKVNEDVFLASNKKLYTIDGEEICEQNYNIDYLEMSKQYDLNFNK